MAKYISIWGNRKNEVVFHTPLEFKLDIKLLVELKYYCDTKRHLVCIPYSIENFHEMAKDLNIDRCWFHKDHYDIPKQREGRIQERCTIVSTREIVLIRNGYRPIKKQ